LRLKVSMMTLTVGDVFNINHLQSFRMYGKVLAPPGINNKSDKCVNVLFYVIIELISSVLTKAHDWSTILG